jgi:hypothetical protein
MDIGDEETFDKPGSENRGDKSGWDKSSGQGNPKVGGQDKGKSSGQGNPKVSG